MNLQIDITDRPPVGHYPEIDMPDDDRAFQLVLIDKYIEPDDCGKPTKRQRMLARLEARRAEIARLEARRLKVG
jgi:hypothetical protein